MSMPPVGHPSELLGPLVRGELGAPQAHRVETHLATCPDCRAERRALEALLSDEAPGLDDLERTRLRRAVFGALGSDGPATAARPAPRFAPVLGVAAAVVLLLAGVTWVATTLGGAGRDDALTTAEGEPPSDEPAGEADAFERSEAFDLQDEADSDRLAGAGAGTTSGAAAPEPVFTAHARALTRSELTRLGRRGEPFSRFAAAFTAAAATPARRDEFLEALAREAPGAGARAQLRACAEVVFGDPPGPLLPAYGAVASFDGRPALVLGFAFTADSGPLDRFMLWLWPENDCATVLHYEAGRIRR